MEMLKIRHIRRDELRKLREPLLPLDERVPAVVPSIGNVRILENRLTGLFCSADCPESVSPAAESLAAALRDAGEAVIGGFHSPLEKKCLSILLAGQQPIVVCPARSLETLKRLPRSWIAPVAQGRLLLVSHFDSGVYRVTADTAMRRNRLVAALSDDVLVCYASPGGKLEQFCREVITWSKPVLALAIPESSALLSLGVRPVRSGREIADLRLGRLRRVR